MDLRPSDYLVGVAAVGDDWLILSISENGFGKRTPLSSYRLTGRGAKGVINMKITSKIGKVVEVLPVRENTDLMVITCNGQIIRLDSDTIRETGRSAQGVRVVKMADGDKVAAACIVPDAVEDDDKDLELPVQ